MGWGWDPLGSRMEERSRPEERSAKTRPGPAGERGTPAVAGAGPLPGKPDGTGGVVIPGYQPVERIGNAPSFGIWMRAVQTRMDRRVLLKLLPSGLASTADYFSREIGALVRLDGAGVLRVIDEGSADGVRYLVSDEAGAAPLVGGRALREADQWQALARALEDLYRRVGEMGFVLLVIPAAALRRVPAGDIVTADLGWLVPIGEALPAHPSIPQALHGVPAQRWQNARLLGLTLAGVIDAQEGAPPRGLRRAVRELSTMELDPERPDPLAKGVFHAGLLAGERPIATVLWVLAALALVGGAGIYAHHAATGDGRKEPEVVDIRPPDDGGALEQPSIEEPAAVSMTPDAEALAEAALDATLGDLPGDNQEMLEQLGPSLREILEQKFLADPQFKETRAGRRAAQAVRAIDRRERTDSWRTFEPVLELVVKSLLAGRVDEPERTVDEFGRDPPTAVGVELAALRANVESAGARALAQVQTEVDEKRRLHRYQDALDILNRSAPKVTAVGRAWIERRRDGVRAEQERFNHHRQELPRAVDAALDSTAKGRFAGAREELAARVPPPEFPELHSGANVWLAAIDQGAQAFAALHAGLEALGDRPFLFRLGAAVEEVRGNVVLRPAPGGAPEFTVKLAGRVTRRTIPLRELDAATMAELAAGRTEDWDLLIFLLGDRARAVANARGRPAPPAWLPEAEALLARAEKQRIDERVAAGRDAAARGEWVEVYAVLDGLREPLRAGVLKENETEFRRWLKEYWSLDPLRAFPGAVRPKKGDPPSFDPQTGLVAIRYDFGERGENGELPTRDWQFGAPPETARELKGEALGLKGSCVLSPGGNAEIFEGALSVRITLRAVPEPKNREWGPNLNIVLWSDRPSSGRGVLYGVGWRPPNLASMLSEEGQLLLPVSVIGSPRELERGDPLGLKARPTQSPKVDLGSGREWLVIDASSDDKGTRFTVTQGGLQLLAMTADQDWTVPTDARRGTVEIRTYRSRVWIRSIEIRGQLRKPWFGAWVEQRVDEDLRR